MSLRSLSVALAVARRSTQKLRKSPVVAVVPTMIPLFFFASFTGALSSFGDAPGFGYYDYTAFVFVFVLYQAAIYVAIFTSFELASDYQTGVARRMMSAAPRRGDRRRIRDLRARSRPGRRRGRLGVALIAGMPVRGSASRSSASSHWHCC